MAAITRWSTGSAVCSAVLRSPPLPLIPLLATPLRLIRLTIKPAMRELLGRLDQDSLARCQVAHDGGQRNELQHTSLPNFGGAHNELYLKLAEASMARGDPAYARHYLDT